MADLRNTHFTTLARGLWTTSQPALPEASDSAYRGRFNEHRPEVLLRPRPPSFAGDRWAFFRGHQRAARPRRGIRRAQPPDREKAGGAARAHAHQLVLRGLHPHAVLLRTGRQTPRRR